MRERRKAREFALQVLYAYELAQDDLELTFNRLSDYNPLPDALRDFAWELVQATVAHKNEIDEFIRRKSQNWVLERIAVLDRLILRMAATELFYFPDIPPKASISEAVEIGKTFSTQESGAFINGILDAILKEGLEQGRIQMI
jgi:transcription antitermination factor NusB